MLFVGTASAQEFNRRAETQTNLPYFYYAQPGQATVQVLVWGRQSGVYEVPDSTDLDMLLTLAGGPELGPRSEREKPTKVTVRLYRPKQDRQDPMFEAPLDRMLTGEAAYPTLENGDIVVVETVRPSRFTWRDGLSLLTTAASLALLTLRIIDRR
jgi:hypothetical protein